MGWTPVVSKVETFAPAKINLFLHVGDKRADGFHELESLVVFAAVGDALTFEESPDLSLALEGPFAVDLALDANNLVLRAARALAEAAGREAAAEIELTKNLPVASGIGAVDRTPPLRDVNSLATFLKMTSNDLQAPALAIAPVIGEVLGELSRMPGALLWRMSGSGATCFALFEDDGTAQMAAIALAHSHPKWWVQATRLLA